jgi:hypothetical protein
MIGIIAGNLPHILWTPKINHTKAACINRQLGLDDGVRAFRTTLADAKHLLGYLEDFLGAEFYA